MKTGILTFEQFHGKKDIGSSRIRGHWIAEHWKQAGEELGDCEIFRYGEHYDAIIYQKVYFPEHAKAFKGIKILDVCDADWLDWSCRMVEMLEEVDAVTCSSMELTKQMTKFTKKPVYFIPDRVKLSDMPSPKVHHGPTRKVVWFGYSQNFPMLNAAVPSLMKRGLELVVVSDKTYIPTTGMKIEVTNLPFSVHHHLVDIQSGDVVLNPQIKKGKWKFKSDNKSSIAKALGMPVAHTDEELDVLMTEESRRIASAAALEEAKEKLDVKLSVVDYKDVLKDIKLKKTF